MDNNDVPQTLSDTNDIEMNSPTDIVEETSVVKNNVPSEQLKDSGLGSHTSGGLSITVSSSPDSATLHSPTTKDADPAVGRGDSGPVVRRKVRKSEQLKDSGLGSHTSGGSILSNEEDVKNAVDSGNVTFSSSPATLQPPTTEMVLSLDCNGDVYRRMSPQLRSSETHDGMNEYLRMSDAPKQSTATIKPCDINDLNNICHKAGDLKFPTPCTTPELDIKAEIKRLVEGMNALYVDCVSKVYSLEELRRDALPLPVQETGSKEINLMEKTDRLYRLMEELNGFGKPCTDDKEDNAKECVWGKKTKERQEVLDDLALPPLEMPILACDNGRNEVIIPVPRLLIGIGLQVEDEQLPGPLPFEDLLFPQQEQEQEHDQEIILPVPRLFGMEMEFFPLRKG
ncbi:uncharacterized protein [Antedon mediterranea]|uniref:uncharacterized protein n=1 Tax=Antedon mediterranea TaxID=105859 RepID=UPI003AF525E9